MNEDTKNNPFLTEVEKNLPRLLSLFNQDATSSSFGIGDRFHWAWGLIDFGNGTFQGAAHGLAHLIAGGILPEQYDEQKILRLIGSLFQGAERLRRRDGSMEEAFPYEGSFCVTALVAYDLLGSIEKLGEKLSAKEKAHYLGIVEPMISYLRRHDETHAIISNHLATAVAALIKWSQLAGSDASTRGEELLDRIMKHQSKEGWFHEYEGADPGYQSLATYYLSDVHRMEPGLGILEPLRRSIQFLWHFVHPDGSFGGVYGSRNTRFYYPAGIEYLSGSIPEAAAMASALRESVDTNRVVTLSAVDESNLIPMFNAYAWAATLDDRESPLSLPCRGKPSRTVFNDAGLLLDRGDSHYTVVSMSKGGVVYHFNSEGRRTIDCGVVVEDRGGRQASSQNAAQHEVNIDGNVLEISSKLIPMQRQETSPIKFLALRLLCLSVMRNSRIREKVKQLLVRFLITGERAPVGRNRRRIELGHDLLVRDETSTSGSFEPVSAAGQFVPIHMASQGYWQYSDTASSSLRSE